MAADGDIAAQRAHVWPPVLAFDPGSRETGLCLRVGTDALEAVTVEQVVSTGNHSESVRYALEVVEMSKEITRRNRERLNDEAACRGVTPRGLRRAVETLVAPTGRPTKGRQTAVAPRVLASLPTASTVLGAVVGTWPRTILVAPHGGAGWDAVGRDSAPPTLMGRTPAGWLPGASDRSHQRAAWAIAGAAHAAAMPPLREQAQTAAMAAIPHLSGTTPEELVTVLRAAIEETGSWDLLHGHLPALAKATVGTSTRDSRAGASAAAAVTEYLAAMEG